MPDLPKVEQDFEADATRYVAAIEAMIEANERLLGSVEETVAEVKTLLDSLDGKKIDIELNTAQVAEQIAEVKAELGALTDKDLAVGLDTSQLMAQIAQVKAQLGSLSGVKIDIDLTGITAATGALGALRAAIGAAGQAAQGAIGAFGGLAAGINQAGQAAQGAAGMYAALTLAINAQGNAAQGAAAANALNAQAIKLAGQAAQGAAAANAALAVAVAAQAKAATATAVANAAAAAATTTVAGAALAAVKGFNLFGIGLTGLHWIVMLTFEALSTLLPALTALGAAALASAEGATWIADKMQAVYTATEATSSMLGVTSGQFLGLSGALQKAQTAADPLIYEALGGALNGLSQPLSNGRTLFQGFFAEGVQVIQMLDQFIAKVDVELRGALGAQLTSAFANGVKDLQEWGQVLGNLIHVITNIATAAPGAAEVLLNFLTVITKLLVAITNNQGLVTFIMFLEEAYRWGGLLAKVFAVVTSTIGNVVGAVAKIAGSMALLGDVSKAQGVRTALLGIESASAEAATGLEGAAGVLAGPWGIAIGAAVIGLAVLIDKLKTTQDAAQQFSSSLESAINKATPAQGLTDILTALPQLQQRLDAAKSSANAVAGQMNTTGTAFAHAGPLASQAAQDVGTYTSAQQQMIAQAVNILSENVKVGGTYVGLSQSMALASAAGLTVGQMFDKQGQLTAVAVQQIQNLVRGYAEMDQTGTTLSNDINAINEQTLMQQTDVNKLNQAWDGFIKQLTGVSSGVAGLYTDLQTIGNVTETAKNKIQAFSQGAQGMNLSVGQVAQQLKSFGADSAQVWSNFDSAVNQGETAIDGLRTAAAAGGVSNAQYTESIKGVVAQMLPYVKDSSTATAMLSALAQQAGGPATSNFQTLKSWVGNTTTATDTLNKTVQGASTYMSNLSKAAANLSSTLDSAVAGAVTQGTVNIKGIATATQTLTTDFQQNSNQLNSSTTPALKGWAAQMAASHTPLADAKAMLDQLMTRWGATPGQIAQANSALSSYYGSLSKAAAEEQTAANGAKNLASAIASIPKYTTIQLNELITATQTGSTIGGITPGGLASPHAAGYLVPGYGGGDIHPALLEGGEAVVPKHLTPAVAPFLKAHGVPGFASGTTSVITGGTTAAAMAAIAQDSALIAKAFPNAPIPAPAAGAPQFMGEWLPSSLIGAPAPSGAGGGVSAGGGTPTGGGDTTGHPHRRHHDWWHRDDDDRELHSHITIHMDGRKIWEGQQKQALRYGQRNSGLPTGVWKPT